MRRKEIYSKSHPTPKLVEEDAGLFHKKMNIAHSLSKVAIEGQRFLDGDENARKALVASARELVAVAEDPVESLLWNIWALPTRNVAARIAVDLKIFETAVVDDGRPKTITDLAAPTGASPSLVKRIARICASMRMILEKQPELYEPNNLTRLLAQKEYAAAIIFCFDCTQLSFAQLPAYLKSTKFQNPENTLDGPFQLAHNCGQAFGWLMEHPNVFQAFHLYANMLWIHRPSWLDMYSVRGKLVHELIDGEASSFVDVGGGTGQILQDFQVRVPEYTGRLILQDRPETVKGAHAYFMRYILHDWPDEQCRAILGHLKDVMTPHYSRILINDCVLADKEAAWQHVSLDLFMMAQTSAQERTESEWRSLIGSCGLKVVHVYNKGEGNEGLIEVSLE
ncbi:S-adenosyl-L-methionine-dependent methyltransferase [Amniculicola lignicola CBS 123094]|uniref:S-adenosyl-L-methionine-dependent methyltransferase n=1 Tax=Amniculicola lignicola CBS 123094 TaxID=1392246 RepID=A0A6A5W6L5_9PLEO|nr:S-adenosyl-L-methionine-dependent methyltransferase [Amniculicola lignicola CBS 123094]